MSPIKQSTELLNRRTGFTILFCGIVVAVALRCALFNYTYGPDGQRFVRQSHELMAGEGLNFDGGPTTSVPPGYPVLLAAAFLMVDDPFVAVLLNFAFTIGSCLLVYFSIRPRSLFFAHVAVFALALHPYLAIKCGEVRSETFGLFLVSLLVFTVSKHESGPSPSWRVSFATGVLCLAALLTCPALGFLSFGVWCLLAWRSRRSWPRALSLAAGSLLLFIPWQIHCYHAVGHFEPLMFGRGEKISRAGVTVEIKNPASGMGQWMRSWLIRPRQMSVWWWEEAFDDVPQSVFASASEREILRTMHARSCADDVDPIEFDQTFAAAAERRFNERPIVSHLGLPLLRAAMLWVDMPQISHAQTDYIPRMRLSVFREDQESVGTARAILRFLKSVYSLIVYLGYLAYPVGFCVLGFLTFRDRRLMPGVIVLATVGYTAASAFPAFGEVRRNLPFLPACLFLLYYLPLGDGRLSAGSKLTRFFRTSQQTG